MALKKPAREMGPAHGHPVAWRVYYEREDGSTVGCVVHSQTAFLARAKGSLELRKLPSEVRVILLNDAAPK